MKKSSALNSQMRALLLSFGGSIVAAVVAMLLPTSLWEMFTGPTGISEIFPSTAAPLGDKARALISFLCGLMAFAVLAFLLLRKSGQPDLSAAAAKSAPNTTSPDFKPSNGLFDRIKANVAKIAAARMSSSKVSDLSELPKLRAADAHPDAPPRRPFSAEHDFADNEAATIIAAAEKVVPIVQSPMQVVPSAAASPVAPPAVVPPVAALAQPEEPKAAEISPPEATLTEMIEKLETELNRRQRQLEKLHEVIGRGVAAEAVETLADKPLADAAAPVAPQQFDTAAVRDHSPQKPPLEVVPTPPAAKTPVSDDMDSALRSALETLHRMNARSA